MYILHKLKKDNLTDFHLYKYMYADSEVSGGVYMIPGQFLDHYEFVLVLVPLNAHPKCYMKSRSHPGKKLPPVHVFSCMHHLKPV